MEQQSLFLSADGSEPEQEPGLGAPLASRLRPRTLEEFAGQKHLLGPGRILRRLIDQDQVSSMIFWGPPGRSEEHTSELQSP